MSGKAVSRLEGLLQSNWSRKDVKESYTEPEHETAY